MCIRDRFKNSPELQFIEKELFRFRGRKYEESSGAPGVVLFQSDTPLKEVQTVSYTHLLFIVGDDDQSIYRFRGAKPEIMLGFERDYPGAGRILLDVNYRCTEEIAGPAMRLIENNEKRFSKKIRTNGARGKQIITRIWQDSFEENNRIAEEIKAYQAAGYRYGDIAVLYRTNSGPRLLMEKLMEYNLPFKARDSVPNLYEHWISRNILTYIRIALGSRERADFLQIINRPKRYISRDSLRNPQVSFNELKEWYHDKDWVADRIENLEYLSLIHI